jgi:hypothetical protein
MIRNSRLVVLGLILSCSVVSSILAQTGNKSGSPQGVTSTRVSTYGDKANGNYSIVEEACIGGIWLAHGFEKAWINGAPVWEGRNENGRETGEWKAFAKDGSVASVVTYDRGQLSGPAVYHLSTGGTLSGHYALGRKVGRWVEQDAAGQTVNVYEYSDDDGGEEIVFASERSDDGTRTWMWNGITVTTQDLCWAGLGLVTITAAAFGFVFIIAVRKRRRSAKYLKA